MVTKRFQEQLKAVPLLPGVYLMKDAGGNVLYVGKAVKLRNRLRSYFGSLAGLTPKTGSMVQRIADFEFIVTDTELEALILECTLIKKHRPHYNVLMKDDKNYPYLRIDADEDWAKVAITRRVEQDGARYFGPYADSGSVRKTLELLKKLFPYRACNKNITGADPRPCLNFHIHRCLGPCFGAASKEEYRDVIQQVVLFLEGKQDLVVRDLKRKMEEASDKLQFERAAFLRDQIRAVDRVVERQKIVSTRATDQDVIAFARNDGEACVEVFFVRSGKLVGREHFILQGTQEEDAKEILTSFVKQFYTSATFVPSQVLLQSQIDESRIIERWLKDRKGGKVTVSVPKQGEKRKLIDMVAENASQALEQMRAKWLADRDKTVGAIQELQDHLGLSILPKEGPVRIECYDISNIQGAASVGSMVVFENGQPKPAHYRRFKIKTVEGPDDYAMLQEVLRRRFRRFGAANGRVDKPVGANSSGALRGEVVDNAVGANGRVNNPVGASFGGRTPLQLGEESKAGRENLAAAKSDNDWAILPDLVIVDGGKGQLNAALEVMRDLGMESVTTVSLAKENEEIFMPETREPLLLPRNSQSLYLVQRIRDEAHRFAISYHRSVHRRQSFNSALDDVPGIGPRRKQALLRHFGSLKAIREASIDELAAVVGMTRSMARKVKEAI
ncbi:MAG: excinuclease ABC subunit UvrC [Chloroflexi bacterium]|nr:excinuclease ABC subunit UvrC [Chloroflexota bacterium]